MAFSLFSVCRMAQGSCARAALGLEQPSAAFALALEVLEHHAWHFEVEWPRALGLDPRARELKATLQVLRGGTREEIVKHFREQPTSPVIAQFLRRCEALDEGVTWRTPRVGRPTLAECEAGLAASVDFAGRPGSIEVGPLARVFADPRVQAWGAERGWGLTTRARARLLDAEQAVDRLEAQTLLAPEVLVIDANTRAALVEVARGPLVHRVMRQGDRVVGWRSVAPTEWTFHPLGAVQALRGTMAPAVQERARLLVTLLDPCVACSVEVVDA